MTNADVQVLFGGLDSIVEGRARKAATKRQLEQDELEKELRMRALKQREEDTSERRWDRLNRETQAFTDRADRLSATQATLKQKMEAEAWARDPQNPANVANKAQAGLYDAQAKAVAARPASPLRAQIDGVEEFTEAMSRAMAENEEALRAAQSGAPDGQQRAMKAQMKIATLNSLGQQLLKTAKPEKPTSIVKIKRQSDDGGTTEELEVPADQWNEQHPAWGRFNPTTTATAPTAAGGQIPTLTPQQASAAKPGTRYRTIDGRIMVR